MSRRDFLKMIISAGGTLTAAQFFQIAEGTSALQTQPTKSDFTVIIFQEGDQVVAKDMSGKILSYGLLENECAKVIQTAINLVEQNKGGVIHIKAGVYNLISRISIASLTNVILEGEGRDATILRASVPGMYMIQKGSVIPTRNALIRNMTIDGNNISSLLITLNGSTYDYILENIIFMRGNAPGPQCFFVNCYNLTIRNCVFKDPASVGDLVAVKGSRITVTDCFFSRLQVPGGGLTSGGLQESKIVNCMWDNYNGYGAISFENFEFFDNILITGNSFKNCAKNGASILTVVDSTPYGVSAGHTHNRISIIGNHFMNTGPIRLRKKTSNVIIQGNTMEDSGGILVSGPNNIIISSNIITNTNENYPIIMYETNASNIIIQSNIIDNSINTAITVRAAHNFHIADNIITNPGTKQSDSYNGIYIQSFGGVDCEFGKIAGNTIISTNANKPKYSIFVEGNHIEVKNNKVKGFALEGIGKGSGLGITIAGNEVL